VEKDGLAAANGIKEGDIITSVNKQAVTNPVEFRDALQTSDPQKGVILNLISDGNSRFQVLKPEDN
jgi:S1-C subfamily serine protease